MRINVIILCISKLEQFIYKVLEEKVTFFVPEGCAFHWQTSECEDSGFLFLFSPRFPSPHPYASSNFRHFYARKGGTLKWRHRVVAYGCGYLEITVSVYALRSPRLSFLFADHPFLLQSVCIWRIASFLLRIAHLLFQTRLLLYPEMLCFI